MRQNRSQAAFVDLTRAASTNRRWWNAPLKLCCERPIKIENNNNKCALITPNCCTCEPHTLSQVWMLFYKNTTPFLSLHLSLSHTQVHKLQVSNLFYNQKKILVSIICYFLGICSDSQVINGYRISWKESCIPDSATQSINLCNNFQMSQMQLNKGWDV